VGHTFDNLSLRQFFSAFCWQRWYDCLRVASQQVVSQHEEVTVEPFYLPFNRKSFNRNHLCLRLHSTSQCTLTCDKLVKLCDDTGGARVDTKYGILRNLCLLPFEQTIFPGSAQYWVKHAPSRRIQLTRQSRALLKIHRLDVHKKRGLERLHRLIYRPAHPA